MEAIAQTADDYFLEKKFEVMLDINNKKIAKELARITELTSQLAEELAMIKRQLSEQRQAVHESSQEPAKAAVQSTLAAEPQKPKQELSSSDVSIEKFFYFGNKR